MRTRLVASVVATTMGLAFWWALTEPLPVPPLVLLGVPAAILVCTGIIAGRLGAVASPLGLLFSLLLGSILSTRLYRYYVPEHQPIGSFGGLMSLSLPELLPPLALAALLGLAGGVVGERLAPPASRDADRP